MLCLKYHLYVTKRTHSHVSKPTVPNTSKCLRVWLFSIYIFIYIYPERECSYRFFPCQTSSTHFARCFATNKTFLRVAHLRVCLAKKRALYSRLARFLNIYIYIYVILCRWVGGKSYKNLIDVFNVISFAFAF